ncbi:hypothetical protein PVL29_026392 [Vitis rotundifolia]|uniref:Uncharacterized protein n=1 Tax=Vitis rotundifolia TaxID=103349 RepID=A0AA39D6N5_VITRO|nr:hypothetical protein PVL29_026392 [Vitis rotundifolia]
MMFKGIVFHAKSGAKLKAFEGKFLVRRQRPFVNPGGPPSPDPTASRISTSRIGVAIGNASIEWTRSSANSCNAAVECAGSSLLTDSATPTLLLLLTG